MTADRVTRIYEPVIPHAIRRTRHPTLLFIAACGAAVVATWGLIWVLGTASADRLLEQHVTQWRTVVYGLILTPLVPAFGVWLLESAPKTLEALISDRLARDPKERIHLTSGVSRFFSSRNWWKASAAVAAVGVLINLYYLLDSRAFYAVGGLVTPAQRRSAIPLFVLSLPITWVAWYLVGIAVAVQICMVRALHWLFRNAEIRVDPLHPDRCGGLRLLSQYALRFTYLIALCGCGLALIAYSAVRAGTFAQDFFLQIAILAYAVLAPVCFFASLGSAHEAMKSAKDELLSRIADRFNATYSQLQSTITTASDSISKEMARIEELQKLHDITARFPVWPFDAKSLRRFSGAVLSPCVPVALNLIRDWIVGDL